MTIEIGKMRIEDFEFISKSTLNQDKLDSEQSRRITFKEVLTNAIMRTNDSLNCDNTTLLEDLSEIDSVDTDYNITNRATTLVETILLELETLQSNAGSRQDHHLRDSAFRQLSELKDAGFELLHLIEEPSLAAIVKDTLTLALDESINHQRSSLT